MGALCRRPSYRAAFYPGYRLGDKGQRRGLWGFHDHAGPDAPTGSRPRGGRIGMVGVETGTQLVSGVVRLVATFAAQRVE